MALFSTVLSKYPLPEFYAIYLHFYDDEGKAQLNRSSAHALTLHTSYDALAEAIT